MNWPMNNPSKTPNPKIKNGDIIVDYGCGKEEKAFFLNNRVGFKVIGIDFSTKLLKIANKNLKQ